MTLSAFLRSMRAPCLTAFLLSSVATASIPPSYARYSSPINVCNATDKTELYQENHDFATKWRACSSILGLDVSCVINDYPHMSEACVGCFAAMTSCGLENCKRKCAPWPFGNGHKSLECKQCSERYCGADIVRCTGVPSYASIPAFQH